MSQFTPETGFSIKFDGDTVSGSMKRLKRGDFLKLYPDMDGMAAVDAGGKTARVSIRASVETLDRAAELLPGYVTEFKGLRIGGVEVGADGFFKEFAGLSFFSSLVSGLLGHLMNTSYLLEDEEKKSGSPSGSTSQDSSGGKLSLVPD